MIGDSYTLHPKELNMPTTTFDSPDLSVFTLQDAQGLEATGRRIQPDHALLDCRIAGEDQWCRRCGC